MENIYTISAYVKGPSGPVCLSSILTPSTRTPPSPGRTSLSIAKHLSTVYISSSTQAAPPSATTCLPAPAPGIGGWCTWRPPPGTYRWW